MRRLLARVVADLDDGRTTWRDRFAVRESPDKRFLINLTGSSRDVGLVLQCCMNGRHVARRRCGETPPAFFFPGVTQSPLGPQL